jgi:alpha-D-ribose 1-methylphosphonate 5-triphosphate synthase subunit PhnH
MTNKLFAVALVWVLFCVSPKASALTFTDVRSSNHLTTSVDITWVTDSSASTTVDYGTTPALGSTATGDAGEIHKVTLSNLQADETYFFQVVSDGEVDNNNGEFYQFKTASTNESFNFHTLFGFIRDVDSQPVADALVLLTVEDSLPLSVLTGAAGDWALDLVNLRAKDTSDPRPFANGETVSVTVYALAGKRGNGTHLLAKVGAFAEQISDIIVSLPANVPPSFDEIPNQTVLEDSGTTTVPITNVSPGPPSESSQTVTLTATSSHPSIVPNPTITGTGVSRTLNFTPADDAHTNPPVIVTVTAQDDGGAANGGVDTFQRTFEITVTAVNDAPSYDIGQGEFVVLEGTSTPTCIPITNVSPGPDNESHQTVSFTATSSDTSIVPNPTITGSGSTRELCFTPVDNANGPVTISVVGQDDGGTENGGIDTGPSLTLTITVTDVNDAPGFDPIPNQTVSEDSGTAAISITNVSPGPVNELAQTVILTAISSDTSIIPNPTITGSGATRTLSFTPVTNAHTNPPVTITVTAQDDGGTANGGVDTFQRTFEITVTAVNDAPSFDTIFSDGVRLSWREDRGQFVITAFTNVSPGPANEANQTVTLTATSSDTTIFPHPSITGTGATRSLSFDSVPNANGTVTVRFTAQDDGGTENGGVDTSQRRTVTVVVAPVNDPPNFEPITDQTVLRNSGQTDITITGVSPGPTNEAAQTVAFTAVSSDTGIVPNPTITGTGNSRTLSFTPVADTTGTVTVTVTATDDGGTANEGTDTFQRTFTISVARNVRTLTVKSVPSGIPIGGNTTPYTEDFPLSSEVTLSAPETFSGHRFDHWDKDGVDQGNSRSITVRMDADHTITAFFLPPPPGDLNGDGAVSPIDALLILQFVVGHITEFPVESLIENPPDPPFLIADLSGDGVVSAYDAALIFQFIEGRIDKFPVEEQTGN